jgi:hypothetical protein
VVFEIVGDPVKLGLVASFNRPGSNVTGVAPIPYTIVAKQFEALHETVPTAIAIGCLLNPNNPNTETHTREAQEAAHTLGRKLELLHARNETEIETAFWHRFARTCRDGKLAQLPQCRALRACGCARGMEPGRSIAVNGEYAGSCAQMTPNPLIRLGATCSSPGAGRIFSERHNVTAVTH